MNDRAPSCGKGARFFDRRFSFPHFSQGGCAARNDDYLVASVLSRPAACPIAVFDLLMLLDQAKSTRNSVRRKTSDRFFGKYPAPPIGRFLRGADLPPFVTERWCQKCPPGEKLRETHSVSLKRAPAAGLQANRPRFLTLVVARFFFRTFRNAETVVRFAQR